MERVEAKRCSIVRICSFRSANLGICDGVGVGQGKPRGSIWGFGARCPNKGRASGKAASLCKSFSSSGGSCHNVTQCCSFKKIKNLLMGWLFSLLRSSAVCDWYRKGGPPSMSFRVWMGGSLRMTMSRIASRRSCWKRALSSESKWSSAPALVRITKNSSQLAWSTLIADRNRATGPWVTCSQFQVWMKIGCSSNLLTRRRRVRLTAW